MPLSASIQEYVYFTLNGTEGGNLHTQCANDRLSCWYVREDIDYCLKVAGGKLMPIPEVQQPHWHSVLTPLSLRIVSF